jgi:heme-degrading monooxygenase HmoA
MSFEPEKVPDFLLLFDEVKNKIANSEGCEGLTLLRDSEETNVLFTHSFWTNEACLNKYRFSPLFKDTWARTKVLFNNKPMAWSLLVEDLVK